MEPQRPGTPTLEPEQLFNLKRCRRSCDPSPLRIRGSVAERCLVGDQTDVLLGYAAQVFSTSRRLLDNPHASSVFPAFPIECRYRIHESKREFGPDDQHHGRSLDCDGGEQQARGVSWSTRQHAARVLLCKLACVLARQAAREDNAAEQARERATRCESPSTRGSARTSRTSDR